MNMNSFTDELLKISTAGWPVQAAQSLMGAGQSAGAKLGGKGMALAIPATALASIFGWEKAKQLKRRHDIGKMVEESQQRG